MKQILRAPWAKPLAKLLAVVMALQYIAVCVPPAHAQTTKQTTAVAVVPLTDNTGYKSQIISAKATDAVALALEDSSEFIVTSQADLQREMKALSLAPPLLESEQVRLGKRLRVDKVVSGTVESLAIEGKSGRCNVALDIRSLDINTEEYLNGAGVSITTKPIPGWEGDDVRVINEGLREASEEAVRKMLATRTPRGSVDVVDDNGTITLSVGLRDGVSPGRELLVARPQWQPDQEKVFLRKIGVIAIDHVDADMSSAHFVSGLMPRTGDKVYALYKPGLMTEGPRHADMNGGGGGHGGGGILGILLGVALLVGILGTGNGPSNATASTGVAATWNSTAFHITYHTASVPSSATVGGYLLFRFSDSLLYPTNSASDALIDEQQTSTGNDPPFNDNPTTNSGLVPLNGNFTFPYWDYKTGTKTSATGTVTATYNHFPMEPGRQYWYKIRRVGTPASALQQGVSTTAVTTLTFAPPDIVSDWSDASPAFHYITPATPTLPSGSSVQDRNAINFTWTPAGTGTNTGLSIVYQVQVSQDINFATSVTKSPNIIFLSNVTTGYWSPTTLGLTGNAANPYYWRVVAHVLNETNLFYSQSASFPVYDGSIPVLSAAVAGSSTPTTAGTTTAGTTPAATTTARATPATPAPNSPAGKFLRGRRPRR